MGTDCAPQLANLMLHNMEYTYLQQKLHERNYNILTRFKNCFRYIDDLTIINGNNILDSTTNDIYPNTLTLKKVNTDTSTADILDIHCTINNGQCITKTHDKRRSFPFEIMNFPHTFGNVPLTMCNSVYCEQLRRHSTLNTTLTDYINNIIILNASISKRGYSTNTLYTLFRKSCRKYKIHSRYNTTVENIINAIF